MMARLKQHLQQLHQQQTGQPIPSFRANRLPSEQLEQFILCLPAMLSDLNAWCEQTDGHTQIKRLYSYVLAYVFHGVDLLPEVDFGFWGYLDDAYMAALAIAKTWGEMPLPGAQLPSYLPDIQRWIAETNAVIPEQVDQINQVFGQMLLGNYQTFDETLMNCQPV